MTVEKVGKQAERRGALTAVYRPGEPADGAPGDGDGAEPADGDAVWAGGIEARWGPSGWSEGSDGAVGSVAGVRARRGPSRRPGESADGAPTDGSADGADGDRDGAESAAPGDRELWQRAGAGDGEALGLIFDRHAVAIRRFCAARMMSADGADDAVQIVFLEAWRRRGQVELVAESALPWLLGVARHTMLHRARAERRHRAALERLTHPDPRPDLAEAAADHIDAQRRLAAVTGALAQLSGPDREVLAVCVGQRLDYAAAAVALDLPIGTVRSRLSRARRRLARAVAGGGDVAGRPAADSESRAAAVAGSGAAGRPSGSGVGGVGGTALG